MDCGFRCDIMVNSKVIVEVKAVEELSERHLAQVLTYLKITEKRLGLLMNFNVLKLKNGINGIGMCYVIKKSLRRLCVHRALRGYQMF
jgi:GxxExxY protein